MPRQRQGRLAHKARCEEDAHGCVNCPHPVEGRATRGARTVFVNGQPALRIGDTGIHRSCCGLGTWTAGDGSSTVWIEHQLAHRKGDMTVHCGGIGELIEGSPDVYVGD